MALLGETRTILLVEDNPDDESLAIRALGQCSVRSHAVVARDGAEALHLLHGADAIDPDLVLLDLKIPKVPGLDVLRRIRANERTRTIPVVVLSSSDEATDIDESFDLGANSYIRKSVDLDAFVEMIQQVGSYWLGLNLTASEEH